MEFKEFESRFKSAKTRFKLSASLNLETFDTILSGTNHIKTATYNLNRRSNSLNSATHLINILCFKNFSIMSKYSHYGSMEINKKITLVLRRIVTLLHFLSRLCLFVMLCKNTYIPCIH